MSDGLGAVCDEFYVSSRLFLKLEMQPARETILHFFDRIRKDFPLLRKMRTREGGSIILEEDADEDSSRRWIRSIATACGLANLRRRIWTSFDGSEPWFYAKPRITSPLAK